MEGRAEPVTTHAPITRRRMWQAERSEGRRLHAGVDLSAPRGTPVLAPEGGVVEDVELDQRRPWRGYAPVVLLRGDSGVWHVLSHLDGAELAARVAAGELAVGQRVELGAELGRIGSERHVHWEVRLAPQPRWWTDPLSLQRRAQLIVELSVDPLAWTEGELVPFRPSSQTASQTRRRALRPCARREPRSVAGSNVARARGLLGVSELLRSADGSVRARGGVRSRAPRARRETVGHG